MKTQTFGQLIQRARRALAFGSLCALIVMLGACTAVPPRRTLPEHIKRIYIPEFRNLSRLYGAQAPLTLYVNDAFMLDGRLDVVQNERADMRLEGRVKNFREFVVASSGDRFPLISAMEMQCAVELWDPYDADRIAPTARYFVSAAIQYVSDPRRAIEETQTEARERLYRTMAANIVQTVMTGTALPPSAVEQRGVARYQERHSKQQYEPVLGEPRFPEPTPLPGRQD